MSCSVWCQSSASALPGASARDRYALLEPKLERFIGVIYRPETERWSHYSECVLPNQFDAWVWFGETKAVTPLPDGERPGEDDT
jgi:erythromycin esterase-like protein